MDPVRNPFAPGAGNPPPELAGRSGVLEAAEIALRRIAIGNPAQSQILVGLRGVGKTVLLVRIREIAESEHYKAIAVEAHEGKSFPEMLVPKLREILYSLSLMDKSKDIAKRGLRILKSFINRLKVKYGEIEFGMHLEPEIGVADSGDLESDLTSMITAVGLAARASGHPIVLLIDELQYLSSPEFSAIIMAMHKVNQDKLPVLMIGAGLPQIPGLAGESKSYAERLYKYPKIGALEPRDAEEAIIKPTASEGVKVDDDAILEILTITERYPYFIQQWAHDAWNVAERDVITKDDVVRATPISLNSLDDNFFRVRFDRCTPAERRYMRALAHLGSGVHKSGDIADLLGVKTPSVGPTRGKLIKKGMIYSPAHGDTAFTVPMFDAYMRRVMPHIDWI